MTTRCKECGSDNVEFAVWWNPNTREVTEHFGSWNEEDTHFCNNCDGRGTLHDDTEEAGS